MFVGHRVVTAEAKGGAWRGHELIASVCAVHNAPCDEVLEAWEGIDFVLPRCTVTRSAG